jgi:hypothetical protein
VSAPGAPHLRVPLTSFIGREAEAADVERLLAKSRLVTLSGAGGVGKTRLALHITNQVADAFDDGVCAVDFTLGSVARRLSCATAAGLDGGRADLLADGICVHTTPGIRVDTDGTIGCYLQWGAMVDGAGLRMWDIAPRDIEEVLRRYPRGDFKRELIGMMRAEAAAVPRGRFGLLVRSGLPLAVRMAPFDS